MRIIALVTLLLFFASPALATQCPSIWQQIEAKMDATHSPDIDKAKFMELLKKGEELHHLGNHGESITVLTEVLEMLG